MRKETLEEAAERIYTTELVMDVDISGDLQSAFINGAKWQQERSYSEEDMVKFVSFVGKNYIKAKGFYYMKGDFEKRMKVSIHQIFEQFKKK